MQRLILDRFVIVVLRSLAMVEPSSMPGNNTFVAGFTQSNVGDTSPNTYVHPRSFFDVLRSAQFFASGRLGAFCESPGKSYDGMPCDFNSSTCGGTVEDCHGRYVDIRALSLLERLALTLARAAGALDSASRISSLTGSLRSCKWTERRR